MKIRYILSLLTVAFLLGSCATPKVAYFTDLKRGTAEQVLNPLEIRIRPEDKISIQVNSKDPLLMNLFNLPIISRQIGTTSGTSNSQGISGYTINKDGDIDFPVLGHIHVAGMTRAEIASYIKEELVSKNLVKDPVVTTEGAIFLPKKKDTSPVRFLKRDDRRHPFSQSAGGEPCRFQMYRFSMVLQGESASDKGSCAI